MRSFQFALSELVTAVSRGGSHEPIGLQEAEMRSMADRNVELGPERNCPLQARRADITDAWVEPEEEENAMPLL